MRRKQIVLVAALKLGTSAAHSTVMKCQPMCIDCTSMSVLLYVVQYDVANCNWRGRCDLHTVSLQCTMAAPACLLNGVSMGCLLPDQQHIAMYLNLSRWPRWYCCGWLGSVMLPLLPREPDSAMYTSASVPAPRMSEVLMYTVYHVLASKQLLGGKCTGC